MNALQTLLYSLSSEHITLHPVCWFDVAVQGEPKKPNMTYVKAKQLNSVDREGDAQYYLLSNLYSYIRQLECDVQIACNENIVQSVMENIAYIELYMKLAKTAYERTKQNQHLWKFYKDNIEKVLSQHKDLGNIAVELSEQLLEKNSVQTYTELWPMYKAAQKAVKEAYEDLLKEQEKNRQ